MDMAVATPIQIRFERFNGDVGIAPAKPPRIISPGEKPALIERARKLLKERDAVLVAHYYVHPDLQDLAQETGGTVSDSLEMARFGHAHARISEGRQNATSARSRAALNPAASRAHSPAPSAASVARRPGRKSNTSASLP